MSFDYKGVVHAKAPVLEPPDTLVSAQLTFRLCVHTGYVLEAVCNWDSHVTHQPPEQG